ncbi:tRNA dimethylallyltransferase 1 [Spirochaetia bacterium]|nr:tRNA dimethylallyltransferase 1 [Spirochaetia bacterium]
MEQIIQDSSGIPVFVLFGPTASGKTEILKNLFSGDSAFCPAEVISADSMQVYRGLDIGTAKPDKSLQEALPHHLIDVLNPNEQFNAGIFVRLAGEAAADIWKRGKLPVLSGGAGFYLRNFIEGLSEAPPSDPELRNVIQSELMEKGASVLMDELKERDPVSAGRIHINDTYRIVRALEVTRRTGCPLSSFAENKPDEQKQFRFLTAALEWERAVLYERINRRTELMFSLGLADEVAALFKQNWTPRDPALKAIGYNEFFVEKEDGTYFLSEDLEGVQKLVAQNSRRYAKRQITWFKNVQNVRRIKLDQTKASFENALSTIKGLLSI